MRTPEGYLVAEPSTSHGLAEQMTVATCECGAVFEGDHEAEALALWAEHCEACE